MLIHHPITLLESSPYFPLKLSIKFFPLIEFPLPNPQSQQPKLKYKGIQCLVGIKIRKKQHAMGNQYNLCNNNTQQQTIFLPHNIQNLPPAPLIQSYHKTLEQFIDDNADFFAHDTLAIVHVLLALTNFQQQINKFPIEKTLQNKKVFLPALTLNDFVQYQGECMVLNYDKSQLYIGSVDYGRKSGYGISIDAQGNKFQGEWARDLQNGQGTFEILYPKRVYKGEWKNGKIQGHGSAVYQDGATYQGNFCQGKKHGVGLLTFLDGATYEGYFFEDLMHGYGTLTTAKGREISGEWKEGKYQIVKPQRSSQTFTINQLPAL